MTDNAVETVADNKVETLEVPEWALTNPVFAAILPDAVAGINEINAANVVLLGESKGTGDREIDKILKDEKNEVPAEVSKAWKKAEEAKALYKEFVSKARNAYRTEVLNEEEQDTSEVDKDALKETRGQIQNNITLLKGFAESNGNVEAAKWLLSVEIPMVGRKGSSTAEGVKRHRVFVTDNDTGTKYDSFTQAANETSTKTQRVAPQDLSGLWDEVDGSEISIEVDGATKSFTVNKK